MQPAPHKSSSTNVSPSIPKEPLPSSQYGFQHGGIPTSGDLRQGDSHIAESSDGTSSTALEQSSANAIGTEGLSHSMTEAKLTRHMDTNSNDSFTELSSEKFAAQHARSASSSTLESFPNGRIMDFM